MNQCTVVVSVVIAGLFFHLTAAKEAVQTNRRSQPDLNFAETMYVTMSGACRAIMNLRSGEMVGQEKFIKNVKVLQLDGNIIRSFPINEAYTALTQHLTFDISKETKIVIHGYKDNSQSAIPQDLAQAYNEKAMFNVLLLDAEEMLNKWYMMSVHNTRLVGKRLANLLANLEKYGASAEDFHLIGISLGAHVAGWTGKYFRKYKNRNLGRITGLDPAGPCFSFAATDQRLDKSDADYVDVVHSNRLIQGIVEPLGHADFYINGGGPNQPGCFSPSCSHLRAAQVYTESIRHPKSLIGIKCRSWKHFEANACERNKYAVLGYGSSSANRGFYYLRTAADPPLALGMEGTKALKTNEISWSWTINLT